MKMNRLVLTTILIGWPVLLQAHHWVVDDYEEEQRVTVEVEVEEFRFIYPHPFIIARIPKMPDSLVDFRDGDDDTWDLEMDNRRELIDLGFDKTTFEPGDRLIVTVDPSPFKKNALYIRVIEHPVDGYRYVHNRRQLYPVESTPVAPR